MISDGPDEDAEKFDDEILLGTVVGRGSPNQGSGAGGATPETDWPPPAVKDIGLNLDQATLAWFKSHHADWRAEIGHVLQAWVVLKSQAVADCQSPG